MKARILLVLVGFVGLMTLTSCGQDVCIAGIGNCDAYKKGLEKNKDLQGSGGTGTPPTDRLAIGCSSWGQCWMVSGQSITFTASGGTAPYTFAIKKGTVGADSTTAMVGNKLTWTTSGKMTLRVRVYDATNPPAAGTALDAACDLCEVDVTILPVKP